ncbi:gliding motility-associated C-terminal domain-containing protein [Sediminibacter sp. Hel_I_10]|uniref:gliding motility-associated C-terminal domain-containing protein n=1 Tax=Sediminibacter sp. Hel_I_10 TaxID=1392490 RepID=UPI000B1A6DF9|nr:gliding motility-associated C-terminal domain-containing protein [Sediminibacter sp. Hel_I_10]
MKKITLILVFVNLFFVTLAGAQITSIDCAVGPENINYCYTNNDDTTWVFQSTDGSPLRITFNAGGIESCCDDIILYEGTDNTGAVIYSGNNGGNLAGLQFDSTGDSIYMEIDADGSISCSSGSACCTSPWDFTVSCATCVNPVVANTVRQDCENGPQFFVDVDLTDLGSATSITLTDNQGSTPQTTDATGLFSFGPFANGTDVVITTTNDDDANCVLTSGNLTQDQCVLNQVDCAVGPVNINYCYTNNDDTTWLFQSTDGSPLRITFNAGGIESCCDDIILYEGTDNTGTVIYSGNNGGDLTGLQFDSIGDSIFMEIDADGSVSCDSGSACCTSPWDFTVSCATCVNPVVENTVRQDCLNGPQFFVDVDLTDLGSATSITLTDNQGSTPQTTDATGVFSFGPFANGTDVVITTTNDDDANCVLTSANLTQDQCVLNQVDCAVGPVNINYCYTNNDDTTWLFQSTDGSPLRITFNAGGIESCCDDIILYEGTDNTGAVIYSGNNGGDLTGLQFDSIGDSIFMEIDADGSVSCDSGSTCCTSPWDFTVSCATCVNPEVTSTVDGDCLNGPQFFVDVDLTDLGSATSVTITDDQGSTPETTSIPGVFTFGPFANNTVVEITVVNDDDANCTIVAGGLTQEICLENLVDCNEGPLSVSYCYLNNDPNLFSYVSSDGTPLNLTFNSGEIEGAPFDFLIVYDSDGVTELYNGEGNDGDLSGLTFQSTGDTIFFQITSDGSVSCESSATFADGINYTVSCATCINPAATYQVVDDCDNGDQFLIDVNITSLGDATSLTISNNIDATTVPVTSTGIYQVGPFPFLTDVVISVSNDQDVNCVINSSAIQLLACPPENDNPCNATIASVNEDESCSLTTPGTLIEATDSGVPNGSCTGNPNDDVWFEFTALGEQQIISINNITGGSFNIDHAVYEGACDNLTQLYCSDDVTSVTPTLTIGNTYYIRVFSGGNDSVTSNFDLCINTLGPPTFCLDALPICALDLEYPSVTGDLEAPPYLDYGCLGSQPDPTWNAIYFDLPGDYTFTLAQTGLDGLGNDIDFIVWGPFNDQQSACYELLPETVADCSFSAVSVETITLNNVQEGDVFLILITNFSQDEGFFTFEQTTGPDNGTNCEIVCDAEVLFQGGIVEEDPENPGFSSPIEFCGVDSVELEASSPYADSYQWYSQNGIPIDGATSETLTVTESGEYFVQVSGDVCEGFSQSIEVIVNLGAEPVANTVEDIITCDDASADNFEDFDLDAQTAAILGGQDPADFNVSYHTSLQNAQLNQDPLVSPYTNISNPQTIFVRVEDANLSACFATSTFELVISGPTPTVTSVPIEACDDGTGTADFDLAAHDGNILNGQSASEFTVTYYETEDDAIAGTNAIDTTLLYNSGSQTIYTRVESNLSFDCYSTTPFDLVVLPLPSTSFSEDMDYEICPDTTVPLLITAIPNNYSAEDVSIVWYADGGVIEGENNLTIAVLDGGLYEIEVTFNNGPMCAAEPVGQEVIELASCVIPQGISPNGDMSNDEFDLSSFNVKTLEIFNRYGTSVYSKNNYIDEWVGQTDDGEELPVGTYFYSILFDNGERQTGWVYIQRPN